MNLRHLTISISVGLSTCLLPNALLANPTGAQVVNGQVSFSQPNLNTLQVNNSNGAIINWQDFSINANELTHFQQSGANSAVLNQVVGNNTSNILGSLTSNGQVYLINPNGIIFGQNSVVNTAGFIASTLNLSDQDFLDGKFNFEGVNAADILNQGYITAGVNGDIALIAPNIINEGVINVENGDVILAAGEKVTLASLQASDVGFEIQSADNTVTNLGSVITDGGAVGMFAGSLQHEGVIAANALSLDENGNVILIAKNNLTISEEATVSANGENGGRVLVQNENGTTWVSGTIEANGTNGKGGVVDVLGQQVGLIDSANISADGTLGGGEIHIGGNYQGNGPLQNASGTYVGENTSLSVDAIESGNGGEVIVWADDAARVYGSISATGGEQFGDGGFVETSGKQYLDVNGINLNLGAINGAAGSWLLDPNDITITSALDSGTVITPLPDFTSSDASNILITTLEAALNTNANVTIATNAGAGGLGDITLDAALDFSLGNASTLTLNADNDIVFTANGSVTVSNASNLIFNLNANNNISLNGAMTADASSLLTINATADNDSSILGAVSISSAITTNNGDINLFAGSGITLTETADLQTLNGSALMDTVAGNITLSATTSGAIIQTSNGNITLQAQDPASNITLQAGSLPSQITSTGTGNISLIADEINISGTVGTTSVTTLKPFSNVSGIQLVTTDFISAGTLIIGSDELANISGDVVIGDITYNSLIDVNGNIVFSSGSNLALLTAGDLTFTQTAGTAIDVGINSVNLQANKISDIANSNLDILAASLDIQTVNGAGIVFGDEIDISVDNLTFSNSTTGAIAVSNSSTNNLNVSGSNFSNDSGTIIQIDNSSPSTILGNISGGPNGDISITNFGGDVVLNPAVTISAGANAVDHLLSASGSVIFGAASIIHNNSGTSSITIDAADLDVLAGTIDAFNGDIYINPFSSFDIGIGDGTIVSAGLVIGDTELANLSAGFVMIGNNFPMTIDVGTFIDQGILGYDLFLATSGSLTFQPGSGFDVAGGKLTLFAPLLDFTTNLPTITSTGSGVIEFANILDASLQLDATCGTPLAAMCVSQANLDALSGFAKIDLFSEIGSIDFTTAMTFNTSLGMDTLNSADAININGTINVGTNDVFVSSGLGAGVINFTQAGVTGIVANNVTLDAATITNVASTVPDIVSNTLDFTTDNGFGTTAIPFLTSVSAITSGINTNSTFEIYIDNDTPLYIQYLSQGVGAGLSTTVNNIGDITVGTIDGGGNTVILDTTIATNGGLGGAIFDDGVGSPNLTNVYRTELYSENGVGTLANNFELSNINDGNVAGGGLYTSVVSSGDIYIDNVGGAGSAFDIQAVTTGSSGEVFIHNAIQPMNLNASITTTSGNITLESNAAINLIASLNAGGGSDVNVTLLSGSGDITISGGVLSSNAVNLTNNVAGITFGSTGFVLAPNVNLSANGIIDDSAATSAIGNGSQVVFLNAVATGNINLTSVGNDADVVYLQSNAGNVDYFDNNDISLDQVLATGTASIASGGEIFDNNGLTTNITADTASITAVNGIGVIDGIETSLTTSLDFTNSTTGTVHFSDQSVNNLQVFGANNSGNALDFTLIQSQNGSLTVPAGQTLSSLNTDIVLDVVTPGQSLFIDGTVSVSNVNSQINLLSPFINVGASGNVIATGTALNLSVLLRADDMDIFGIVDGGVGDLAIENLTNGNTISLGGTVGDMDLSATDLSGLSAGRISIGQNGGVGTASISIDGAVDLGSVDTRLASVGNIVFNQGAANGISTLANLELNTEGAIIDNSAGGFDISAGGLYMLANNGIGATNAIDTQLTGLQLQNLLSGNVAVSNTSANLSLAFINQDANGASINLSNSGNIDFIDNTVDVPGMTSVNGVVSLTSSAGSILDGGVAGSHILGANSVSLNSSTGIGTLATPITIEDIGTGGLSASATGTGNIYIDHVVGGLGSDFIITGLTAGTGIVEINNLNAAQDMRINGPVTINGGSLSFVSPSSMFVDANITDNGAGTIDLQVTGAGGNLFIGTGFISSNGGNISLTANTDITLNGSADIVNAGGLTSLFATNGILSSVTAAGISGGGDLNASALNGIDLAGNNDVGVLSLNATNNNIVFQDSNNVLLDVITASITGGGVTITSSGAILDANAALNNVTAQTITLNAVNGIGTLADPIETSAENFLQFFNSNLNDVVIVNSVPNNILLAGTNSAATGDVNITYDNNIALQSVTTGGTLTLVSTNGTIQDTNGAGVINLTAGNINLTAFNHIGGGNPSVAPAPIDTQLTGATGVINLANTSTTLGHIEILNTAINTTDVATVNVTNAALNGEVYVLNPSGVLNAGNISSNQGFVELKGLEVRLSGVVNNNDVAGATQILLYADDFNVVSGSLNANAGNIELLTLTDGQVITLGGNVASTLSLVQADIDAFTASLVSIGLMDTVTPTGSGDINVVGSLDFGTADLKLQTLGNINLNNGSVAGLSTSGFMVLVSDMAITSDASTGASLIAPNMNITANSGIGSLNPVRTQTTNLSVYNKILNNVNIANTGPLTLTDSAALGGSLSVSSDSTLTLTPNAGLAGTTGAIATTDLKLEGTGGLIINGVLSAANISLLSENGIAINDTVTTAGNLLLDSDTDSNGVGDLLIENTIGGVLDVLAGNMNLHSASTFVLATSGAVHVNSSGVMNLVAANDLNIIGGDLAGADAYLSAQGNMTFDVGGNILISSGTQINTAASIFDNTGVNNNNLNLVAGGNVTLSAGAANNSGAFITVADLNMDVAGALSLTGGIGDDSPAIISTRTITPLVLNVGGSLTLTDGGGINSVAQISANGGLAQGVISYLDCVGCATGLIVLDQPIENTTTGEITAGQSNLGTEPVVTSTDALQSSLDESTDPAATTNTDGTLADSTDPVADDATDPNSTEPGDEEEVLTEAEPETKVLVCR